MRADRLISLLLLLQTRGRMTAAQLAAELEVTERTVYRDIDALSASGVPIYGERGPRGGYALLDGYRTSLTGLTADQLRAFFMLSIPAPLADLGLADDLRGALLKLSAALPADQRGQEERVRQRFHIDPTGWRSDDEGVPHLQVLQQALWNDHLLAITYVTLQDVVIEQTVEPLGLAAKAGVWYLVYRHRDAVRARRVSSLRDAVDLGVRFQRPAEFDLAAFWRQWCAAHDEDRSHYAVSLRVAPSFLPTLTRKLGQRMRSALAAAAPADAEGWLTVDLSFESLFAARDLVLTCGGGVEVLAPLPLRLSVADYAQQTVVLYDRARQR